VKRTLAEVAADLNDRLISMFRDDSAGRRPVFGDYQLFQTLCRTAGYAALGWIVACGGCWLTRAGRHNLLLVVVS
jgi:hypothetical protein